MFNPPPIHPDRPTVVPPVRVDPRGLAGPTRRQARGSAWRRSSHGLYVPAHVDPEPAEQRIVEAAGLLPPYGGVTGWAALHWLGCRWFDGLRRDGRTRRPVCLATGDIHRRDQDMVAICEEKLDPRDLTVVDGLWVTTGLRSVLFEMRYAANERMAVVWLDMAMYSDVVSTQEISVYAAAHSSWTGIPQARDAIPHSDENAWSPYEVLMRLSWQFDAGLPRPLCNVPIFDTAGRHVGTPDLLDPEAGVIGEYDGSLHLLGRQRAHDIRREHAFRGLGLEFVTMVSADLVDPRDFVWRLRAAYDRARFASVSQRGWTIVPPPWWIPTATVADRRALDPGQRDRLLRHRAAA